MKTKLTTLLLLALYTVNAQITPPPISIPVPLPNYDGSYDPIGQGGYYYPNGGEVRLTNEDRGSASEYVKYYTMYTEPKLYLQTNNNIALSFSKNDLANSNATGKDSLQRIDIEWLNKNAGAYLTPLDTQNTGQLNYITEWFGITGRTNVKGHGGIVCQSIYNNIDLVYTSNNSGLVMYFIVYPGGDYKDILLHFNGSNSSSIVGTKLEALGSWDKFYLQKPKMYQYVINNNIVTPVNVCNANWTNAGVDMYQINNNSYINPSLPLIIQLRQASPKVIDEPGLCWSTYFGGNQFEFLTKSHTDGNDNYYVAGSSNGGANNFPQGPGLVQIPTQAVDGAIAKFNSNGILQWSTFVGGSSNENIRDFDFYAGSIYCVGRTASDGANGGSPFPTKTKVGAVNDATWGGGTGPWDGFVFEFSFTSLNQFQVNWSTLYGGNGWDDLYGCKTDANGNLYFVGASSSSDMAVQSNAGGYINNFNPAQLNNNTPISTDAIIGRFNPGGSINWFTFFGTDILGTNANNHAADYFYGLTLAGNNIYACGKAGGTNLPGQVNNKFVAGQFDGIIASFSTNGILNASKFTDGNISNYAIKELWGEIYTVGETNSSMTPINSGLWYYNSSSSGGNTDACFSVHTSNLSSNTTHNSFFGGNDEEGAYDLIFTKNNLLVITGGTRSTNFQSTNLGSMYSKSFQGGVNDNFIFCLQKGNTNVLWSTCLGSNDFNESQVIPPYINSQFDWANTTATIDSQNTLRLLGTTNSPLAFPLDDGNQIPFFKTSSPFGNDGTITCFDMNSLSAIVGESDFAKTEFAFGMFPNPVSDFLYITNTSGFKYDDLFYSIYDINGKKVITGTCEKKGRINIDVTELQKGIYVINLSDGKFTFSNKFIKTE